MRRPHRLITATIAAALVAAACGSDDAAEPTPEPAAAADEAAPEPEPEPEPEAAPEPEAPAAAPDPAGDAASGDLRSDGLAEHDFGTAAPDVVAGLTDRFGAPASDELVAYDVPSEIDGLFAAGDPPAVSFVAPVGRHVCWSNGLCANFGAEDEAGLELLGWRQTDGPDALTTAAGIAPGSAGADHADEIVVGTGGCFSIGEGTAEGVTLLLESSGVPFLVIDPGKSIELENQPPVDEVSVLELWAGEQLASADAEC